MWNLQHNSMNAVENGQLNQSTSEVESNDTARETFTNSIYFRIANATYMALAQKIRR